MKIEVRDIHTNAHLSEETTAYTATIYIDGAKAFHASNRGTGGCDLFQTAQLYTGPSLREVDAFLMSSQPPMKLGEGFNDVPCDLEIYVGRVRERFEAMKGLKRQLRRKICALDPEGRFVAFNCDNSAANLERVEKHNPGYTVVALHSPAELIERALAAYSPGLEPIL